MSSRLQSGDTDGKIVPKKGAGTTTVLSVVVPCYNEAQNIRYFYDEFIQAAKTILANYSSRHLSQPLEFELIFVDDGSKDATLSLLKELSGLSDLPYLTLKYLSFSRNFGKEAALYAGMAKAVGDYVATMDADMQDPPALLPAMFETLLDGQYDNVATKRTTRQGEPAIRSFFARAFYRVINRIIDFDLPDGARDFRLMKRVMVDAILDVGDHNRFSKGIFAWVGFKTKWIAYENCDRKAGKTKWSFFALFRYAIGGIVSFSSAPLSIASAAGIVLCCVALAVMVLIIVRTLLFGDEVAGWPSLACIILFVGGLQLFCLGIIGQYLAKTYIETKGRPLFIIKESNIE